MDRTRDRRSPLHLHLLEREARATSNEFKRSIEELTPESELDGPPSGNDGDESSSSSGGGSRHKRSRSDGSHSGSDSDGASGSGSGTGSNSVGVLQLPWQSASSTSLVRNREREVVVEHTDCEDVDMEDANSTTSVARLHTPSLPESSAMANTPSTGTRSLNFMALPFHEPATPPSPSHLATVSPLISSPPITHVASAPPSTSTFQQSRNNYTVGLPDQDFFGPGSLRNTTPPWLQLQQQHIQNINAEQFPDPSFSVTPFDASLRSLMDMPIPPLRPPSPIRIPSSSSSQDNLIRSLGERSDSPFVSSRNVDSGTEMPSPEPRSPIRSRSGEDLVSSMNLDSPTVLRQPLPRSYSFEERYPPILPEISPRRPILVERRSSSDVEYGTRSRSSSGSRSRSRSALNEEGTGNDGVTAPLNDTDEERDEDGRTGTGADSPLIPIPPAPRYGMTYQWNSTLNQWTQTPNHDLRSPTPYSPASSRFGSANLSSRRSGYFGPGNLSFGRRGGAEFLELAPSPSFGEGGRWARMTSGIGSVSGASVSEAQTPLEERDLDSRAGLDSPTPAPAHSHSEHWNSSPAYHNIRSYLQPTRQAETAGTSPPWLRSPPSGSTFRNRNRDRQLPEWGHATGVEEREEAEVSRRRTLPELRAGLRAIVDAIDGGRNFAERVPHSPSQTHNAGTSLPPTALASHSPLTARLPDPADARGVYERRSHRHFAELLTVTDVENDIDHMDWRNEQRLHRRGMYNHNNRNSAGSSAGVDPLSPSPISVLERLHRHSGAMVREQGLEYSRVHSPGWLGRHLAPTLSGLDDGPSHAPRLSAAASWTPSRPINGVDTSERATNASSSDEVYAANMRRMFEANSPRLSPNLHRNQTSEWRSPNVSASRSGGQNDRTRIAEFERDQRQREEWEERADREDGEVSEGGDGDSDSSTRAVTSGIRGPLDSVDPLPTGDAERPRDVTRPTFFDHILSRPPRPNPPATPAVASGSAIGRQESSAAAARLEEAYGRYRHHHHDTAPLSSPSSPASRIGQREELLSPVGRLNRASSMARSIVDRLGMRDRAREREIGREREREREREIEERTAHREIFDRWQITRGGGSDSDIPTRWERERSSSSYPRHASQLHDAGDPLRRLYLPDPRYTPFLDSHQDRETAREWEAGPSSLLGPGQPPRPRPSLFSHMRPQSSSPLTHSPTSTMPRGRRGDGAASETENRLHELLSRQVSSRLNEASGSSGPGTGASPSRGSRWGEVTEPPGSSPLSTSLPRHPRSAWRDATPDLESRPALRARRLALFDRDRPSRAEGMGRRRAYGMEPTQQDREDLARSFSSMDEFFVDFDRRNPPAEPSSIPWRHTRGFRDFINDEDFDASYDALTRLGAILGDVKSRATPAEVIAALPHATYKEWAETGSDVRCPICLDDYQDEDQVQGLTDCSHWFHQDCLGQWLKGAQSCPVCRGRVKGRGVASTSADDASGSGTTSLAEFIFGPASS